MIGTMYNQHSLPKAYGGYGGSYGARNKTSTGGVVSTVFFVVLVLACGGLSLGLLSSRTQLRDMSIHHEALSQELTYTKNHLHHVEAQLASREIDYQHLSAELHNQHSNHYVQELDNLRQQKRGTEQSLATANEEITRLKHDLEAINALVEAYKQHLSDEVASHHQREENWLHIQEDWERLEKEMEEEINTLRMQLQIAKLQIPANVKEHHTMPQHIQPEPAHPHDPIYDNLPPAHVPATQHQQQQQQQHQPSPVPQQQQQQRPVTAPTPVPTPVPQQQQHQQAQQQPPSPVPQQQQQQQHTAPTPAPPTPANNLHQTHYDFHLESNDHETHDWQPHWKEHDYDKFFEHHNLYADYPGWVDEAPAAGAAANGHAQQHHGDVHNAADQQWHHQDDSHHFQHDAHAAHQQQQQQQHAQHQQQHQTGHWDHTAGHGHEVYQAHHDDWHAAPPAHDDLSMKLGLGGGGAQRHNPQYKRWHH